MPSLEREDKWMAIRYAHLDEVVNEEELDKE
jgi:hypothetical protein